VDVGIRELKNKLSEYLRLVKRGETLAVTEHGKVIAYLSSANNGGEYEGLLKLLREGKAGWSGGKPEGAKRRVGVSGKSVSRIVIEDRR
jgi:prevent-host-death family protein